MQTHSKWLERELFDGLQYGSVLSLPPSLLSLSLFLALSLSLPLCVCMCVRAECVCVCV